MSMRKHPSRFRAIRPATENLEERQLLSGTVSGVDGDGDTWVLKLIGPGSIRVTKQPDSAGNPQGLNSRSQIDTITFGGTDSLTSKIVGTVKKAATGDGKVFFQTIDQLSNRVERGTGGSGVLSINAADFWLGLTAATAPTNAAGVRPSINIPDGVATLRFGGVDTTAFFGTDPTRSLAQNGQNDQLSVTLGIPMFGGTRVIVDRVISNSQPGVGTGAPTQDGVNFAVDGRINIFQANSIEGNTTNPPATFATAGGTLVTSFSDTLGTTGALGSVRIGDGATNFSVETNDRIRDFFVGGETNNVGLIAPTGARNVYFGKGMDSVEIRADKINKLQANRGAVNSLVVVNRRILGAQFGGDVIDTAVQAGYNQDFTAILQNPTNPPAASAQSGGYMNVTVAGDIQDSVFTASTEPGSNGEFGSPDELFLPGGMITARVEGTIDNSSATPMSPRAAFYAAKADLTMGPVVPPDVPEPPYPNPPTPRKLPGVPKVFPRGPRTN